MRRLAALLLLAALASAACAGGSGGTPPPGTPAVGGSPSVVPPSPAPTVQATAAPAESSAAPAEASPGADFTAGGDRPVAVHVPASADPAGAPLVLALHGYSSNPDELERYFGLGDLAEARGVVVAYPEGRKDARGNRFWNGTDACCAFSGPVADSAYLAGLVDEIASRVPIDPRRVYVVGHSNGGFMSHRMACEHADVVAGIASLAGVTFADRATCKPSGPVAILQVHGTADDTIHYAGGSLADVGVPNAPPYPGAAETVAGWLERDGCDAKLKAAGRLDLDSDLEGPEGPAETRVERSTGCDPGGFVELWAIEGGGHVPALTDAFAGALLGFLLDHPKP